MWCVFCRRRLNAPLHPNRTRVLPASFWPPDDGDFYQELRHMLGMQPEGRAAGGCADADDGAAAQAGQPSKQVGGCVTLPLWHRT